MKLLLSRSQDDTSQMGQETRLWQARYDTEQSPSPRLYRVTTPKTKNDIISYPEPQPVQTRESMPMINVNPQDFSSEDSADALFAQRCRHARYSIDESRDDNIDYYGGEELKVFSADEIHGKDDRYSSAPVMGRIWSTSTDASTHILRRQQEMEPLETIMEPVDSLLILSTDDNDESTFLDNMSNQKQGDEQSLLVTREMEAFSPPPQPTPLWRRIPSILPVQTDLQHIELHEKVAPAAHTEPLPTVKDDELGDLAEMQPSSIISNTEDSGRRPFRFLRWKKKSSPEDISEEPSDLQSSKSSSFFSSSDTEEWDRGGEQSRLTVEQESATLTRESAVETIQSKEMENVEPRRIDMLCSNVVSFEEQSLKKRFRFFRRKKKVAVRNPHVVSESIEESSEDVSASTSSSKENADTEVKVNNETNVEETIQDNKPTIETTLLEIGSYCPSPINLGSPTTRQRLGLFLVDQTPDAYVASATSGHQFASPHVSPQHVIVTEEEKDAMYAKCLMSEDSEASTRITALENDMNNDHGPVAEPPAAEPPAAEPSTVAPSAAETRGGPNMPKPIASEPIASRPIATKPSAAEPIATKPSAAEPIATKPSAAEPIAIRPSAAEPIATNPIATKPIAAEPLAAEPSAVKPTAVETAAVETTAAETAAAKTPAAKPTPAINEEIKTVTAEQVATIESIDDSPNETVMQDAVQINKTNDEIDHEPEIGQCLFFYSCGPSSRIAMNCSRPRTTIECGESAGRRFQPSSHPAETNSQPEIDITQSDTVSAPRLETAMTQPKMVTTQPKSVITHQPALAMTPPETAVTTNQDEVAIEHVVSRDDDMHDNESLLETYELAPVPSKVIDVDANDENIEITRKPWGAYKVYTNNFTEKVSVTTIEVPSVAFDYDDVDYAESDKPQNKWSWFGRTKNNVETEQKVAGEKHKKRSIRDIITQFRKIQDE